MTLEELLQLRAVVAQKHAEAIAEGFRREGELRLLDHQIELLQKPTAD